MSRVLPTRMAAASSVSPGLDDFQVGQVEQPGHGDIIDLDERVPGQFIDHGFFQRRRFSHAAFDESGGDSQRPGQVQGRLPFRRGKVDVA